MVPEHAAAVDESVGADDAPPRRDRAGEHGPLSRGAEGHPLAVDGRDRASRI
ncbi:MAG TPA: hypothetical protein VIW24_14975 [Aldersonia sp.]